MPPTRLKAAEDQQSPSLLQWPRWPWRLKDSCPSPGSLTGEVEKSAVQAEQVCVPRVQRRGLLGPRGLNRWLIRLQSVQANHLSGHAAPWRMNQLEPITAPCAGPSLQRSSLTLLQSRRASLASRWYLGSAFQATFRIALSYLQSCGLIARTSWSPRMQCRLLQGGHPAFSRGLAP